MKRVINYIKNTVNNTPVNCQAKAFKTKELIFILISAITVITICSKSSPIYPFNDWVDSNCFFTVGKSMLYGKVPYRDLFEQKGPLLYMLHAAAALVSKTTFLGVYFIEIAACFGFLFYSFKIMRLYYESASVYLVPVLAITVYTAPSFCHGDSAEELCLVFFAFASYIGLKALHKRGTPKRCECIMLGVTAAFVLWIKFSMLGFYIGWIFVMSIMLIKERQTKQLFKTVLLIAAGVAIASIPILVYFALNNSLKDLFTVYFYDNIFHYSKGGKQTFIISLANNLYGGIKNIHRHNATPMILAVISLLLLPKKKGNLDFWFVLSTLLATFVPVYIGGRSYKYYAHIFSAFAPLGLAVVWGFIGGAADWLKQKSSPLIKRATSVCAALLCVGLCFALCKNTYLLKYKKADLPQYKFAKTILQTENATLLNYGVLDSGFYTTTGIVPNCRYFCKLNIEIEEMMQTQDDFIKNGRVDFVVTRDQEIESDLYICIETATMYHEGSNKLYRLYGLVK